MGGSLALVSVARSPCGHAVPRSTGMRWLGRLALGGLCLTAACSRGASPSGSPTTTSAAASSTSSPATAPSQPPRAQLTLTGDGDVATTIDTSEVTCSFPDVGGLQIAVLAQSPDAQRTYRIAVTDREVSVHVDAGSGGTFFERNFTGPGVSGFDAATGARLDATVGSAAPTPGVEPGPIGALQSVEGTIDCADQTPGVSTVRITGDSPAGRYDAAALDPAVVECYFSSGEVIVLGVAQAADTKMLVKVSVHDMALGLDEELVGTAPRRYSQPASASILTADGAHVAGDVTEQGASPAHVLHVEGDATCGDHLGET
jgi:hypothetical protein